MDHRETELRILASAMDRILNVRPIAREAVEDAFEEGLLCSDCPLCVRQREPHGEKTRSCQVLNGYADEQQCPGVE